MFTNKPKIFQTLGEYCESLGINMFRQGAILRAHCPLPTHKGPDLNASFTVYPNDTFYCFGCLEGGGADRLAFLLKDVPPRILRKFQRDRDIYARKPATEEQIELMTRFLSIYKFIPSVVYKYLETRGLNRDDISKLNVGYCSGRQLWLKPEERKTAYLLGLINSHGWEKLTGKIIIPEIRDGKVIWLQGRSLLDESPKYYNVHIQKPLYGYESLQGKDYIWLVEGVFDAIGLHLRGEPACAIIGSHLQDHQIPNLSRTVVVKICFDNDESGRKSTKRIIQQLRGIIPFILDVKLPKDIKDIGDLYAQGRMDEIL